MSTITNAIDILGEYAALEDAEISTPHGIAPIRKNDSIKVIGYNLQFVIDECIERVLLNLGTGAAAWSDISILEKFRQIEEVRWPNRTQNSL